MTGMDDNVSVIGDWLPPNPDQKALLTYAIAEYHDTKTILDTAFPKLTVASLQESKEPGIFASPKNHGWEHGIQASKELSIESDLLNFSKSSSRGGLADRIAGRAGFCNLTLDTSQIIKATSFPSPTTNGGSPLLTIPPGLSPATLLDSPIFVPNTMAEQSPTRGNSPFVECSNLADSDICSKINDHPLEDIDTPSFASKLPPTYFTNTDKKPALGMHLQSTSIQGLSIQSPLHPIFHNEFSRPPDGKANSADDNTGNERSLLEDEPQDGELSSTSLNAPSEDGYNWRKYGQKQVKGSEYPRSYYKCTHPNCQVKKKVERSHMGHITEIIYKGVHNHLKPPLSHRTAFPSSQSANDVQIDGSEQNGAVDHEWKSDGLDANQTASASIEQRDQFSTLQDHDGPRHETPDGMDVSSTLCNWDEEDQVNHGSVTLGSEADGDETESKRRKLDACVLEMCSSSRAVREPRVVVQTTSDIDILDDGYRWRKYGQKVVKGNPNPRSYYKCTNPGCTVRKHVERASHDLKSVITTYEGKHNHEVPATRTSSNQTCSSANSSIITTAVPPSCLLKKSEPARMTDILGSFDVPGQLGCFGFQTIGQQLGAAGPSFSFAMAEQGLSQNFAMATLGHMASLKMPVLPRLPAYVPQQRQGTSIGFVMPKGVPKEEPAAAAGLRIPGGSAAYHQLMNMRLGPHL